MMVLVCPCGRLFHDARKCPDCGRPKRWCRPATAPELQSFHLSKVGEHRQLEHAPRPAASVAPTKENAAE